MARKPRDYDAELQALMAKAKKLKGEKTTRLGELVQVTGADALSPEALAGALLAAVEQSRQPEVVGRWAERGEAFFRAGGKRTGTGKAGSGDAAGGAVPAGARAAAGDGGA